MKKFFAALLIVGSLFFASTADAEIKTYTGTDDYTVGERETQEDAQNNSKLRALRNAQEQAGLYIRSQSRSKDLELVEDEIVTLTEGIVKIVGAPQYRKEILSDGKSILIHTTVIVQIDTDDLDRHLEEIARRHKPAPTTPIDRPKPIETPAPPVEEQFVEKIEPTAPVETVRPSFMDDKAMELLNLINAERAKAGVEPLKINKTLMRTAKVRLEEYSRKPSNTCPNGQQWWTVLPESFPKTHEDCWRGFDSPKKVMGWFMNNKTELKRILDPEWRECGVVHTQKSLVHYWVLHTSIE